MMCYTLLQTIRGKTLTTKQKNLRLDDDVIQFIEAGAKADHDRPHGQWLSILIRSKLMPKLKKAAAVKEEPLSFESWPYIPDQELITAWLKTKKAAKGSTSQLAISTVGTELHKAQQNGFTVEECLCDAENGKWKGFKASWMKRPENETGKRNTEPSSEADKVRAACEAKRNSSRAEREVNGDALGEDGRPVRVQVHEAVRPNSDSNVGVVHDGDFWPADGDRASSVS